MANTNAPFGFRPVGTLGSAGYAGQVEAFTVVSGDSTAIGIGDPVCLAASSANADGLATVRRATVGDVVIGVMVGVKPTPTDLTLTYRKASTAMVVYVDVDPNTLYEVQEDSDTSDFAVASIGLNADFILGTVNTTTGNGRTCLDSSSADTTTTLGLRVLRTSSAPDNDITASYKRLIVQFNQARFRANSITGIS